MLESMRVLTLLLAALLPAAAQQAAPPAIPADLIWEPDLEYSNPATRLALDIVRPRADSAPLPAIVLIHGGGFRAGTRESYLPLCIKLAQRGYVTATVTYRLSPADHAALAAVPRVPERWWLVCLLSTAALLGGVVGWQSDNQRWLAEILNLVRSSITNWPGSSA